MCFSNQFNDCPIIWMFHSGLLNNKINNLHERYLSNIGKDSKSNFEELLVKDNSVSIHQIIIQTFTIKIYKFVHKMPPEKANEILQLKEINHHNLLFIVSPMHSVYNGAKSASFLKPRIWEMGPSEIKNINSFTGLK